MEHVKTFFKTLLWTLVGIVVVVGGFWAYVRLLDADLGAKVANLIYKTEVVDCPVCLECDECEVCAANEVECEICPEAETCDISSDVDLTDQYEAMDIVEEDVVVNEKLDEILNILKSGKLEVNVDNKEIEPKNLEEALKRIEELEKGV